MASYKRYYRGDMKIGTGTYKYRPYTVNDYRAKYTWKDTLEMPTSQQEFDIEFVSNGIAYTGIRVTTDTLYYVNNGGETEVYNTSSKWLTADIANQTITTSATLNEWIISNIG